jgi:hypothetical protein
MLDQTSVSQQMLHDEWPLLVPCAQPMLDTVASAQLSPILSMVSHGIAWMLLFSSLMWH